MDSNFVQPPASQTLSAQPPITPSDKDVDAVAVGVRTCVVDFLGARIQQLLADADDLLFSMTERASSSQDQRHYLDTMRVLRKQQSVIKERFNGALAGLFAPVKPRLVPKHDSAEAETPTLTLQSSEQLEEELAIANMEAKASGLFREALYELERRLPALAPATRVRANFDVLAPRALCTAFQRALADTDIEFPLKLVIYKLFDRLVVSALGELYESLLALLETKGIRHVASSRRGASATDHGSARSMVDAQTAAMLQGFTAASMPQMPNGSGGNVHPTTGVGYPAGPGTALPAGYTGQAGNWGGMWSGATDHSLAQDLANIARGDHPVDLAGHHATALLRRMQLVGGMLNGVLADPYLPSGTRAAIDTLRFPLIKAALSDASFFSTPTHPVRALLDDVATMAAGSRTSPQSRQSQVEELILQLREQIDVQAALVRSALTQAEPLSDEAAESFLDAQIDQTRRRRRAVIDKIRQRVGLELDQQRQARELPKSADTLLRSAWAPMMGLALLRHGPDSEAWGAGAQLLKRVLEALSKSSSAEVIDQLCVDLDRSLCAAGLSPERISGMVRAFREECRIAEPELETDVPVVDAPAEPAQLQALELPAEGSGTRDSESIISSHSPVPSAPEGDARVKDSPATPASAAPITLTRTECLRRLLTPGQWFRVHDHIAGVARWMRMSERGTGRGLIGFSEFNERNNLSVPLQQFVEDLVHRRSDPIDPSPAMIHALECLALLEARTSAVRS